MVIDSGNQEVKGVLMAACIPGDNNRIISHPGTTFAGPILNVKLDIKAAEEILDLMLSYYEQKYSCIEIRLRPSIYDMQPMEWIQYLLMRRGYLYRMRALSNVINLREIGNEDQVLKFLSSGRRYYVKQALNSRKYNIKRIELPDEVIWNNLNSTLKIKYNSKATHTFEEIQLLCKRFPKEINSLVAERYDESYGAFAMIYRYKNVFHTQYLDLNYHYSSEYPNLQLVYELIKEAKKENFLYFSFGASTESNGDILNYGLYQYKKGYGGGSSLLPVLIWEK